MERLTYDFCIGNTHCWQIKGADNYLCKDVCREQVDNGCEECPIKKAFDRLAAYEDTMPLERAQELAKAEKDGRLVVLPCKVGDFVWVTDDCVRDWSGTPLPYKCWVFGIEITEKENRLHVECCKTGRIFPFDFDQTGKTVFLTREEAEAALKRREEQDNEAD